MLEAYSENLAVTEGQQITFQTVKENNRVVTGNGGNSTLYLNAPGNYIVSFDLTATTTDAGEIAVQMLINGNADNRTAISQATGAGETGNISFTVPVTHKGCCCQSGGTALTFVYTGSAGTISVSHATIWRVA